MDLLSEVKSIPLMLQCVERYVMQILSKREHFFVKKMKNVAQ